MCLNVLTAVVLATWNVLNVLGREVSTAFLDGKPVLNVMGKVWLCVPNAAGLESARSGAVMAG